VLRGLGGAVRVAAVAGARAAAPASPALGARPCRPLPLPRLRRPVAAVAAAVGHRSYSRPRPWPWPRIGLWHVPSPLLRRPRRPVPEPFLRGVCAGEPALVRLPRVRVLDVDGAVVDLEQQGGLRLELDRVGLL